MEETDFETAQLPEETAPQPDAPAAPAPVADEEKLASFGKSELESLKHSHGVAFDDLEQLAASENGEQVLRLWSAGAPLATAWAAVNLDKITSQRAAAAKQSALNAVLGKRHLVPAGGGAAADVPVPQEVYEQYKALLPNFTDAEIRASWQRHRTR